MLDESNNSIMMYDTQGVIRMKTDWRQRLWIDFDRDVDNFKTIQKEEEEVDFQNPLSHTSQLKLNNHTGTDEYLQYIRDSIKGFDNINGGEPLEELELEKIVISLNKAQYLKEIFQDPKCKIAQLIFDKCRAKTKQMSMIFDALTFTAKMINLSLSNMSIPRGAVPALANFLKNNTKLQMLTLLNTNLSDNTIQTLAEGLQENQNLCYIDVRKNSFENDGSQALLRSLIGKKTLITLRVNAIQIEDDSVVELLHRLFKHPNCALQNLEMEELEMLPERTGSVIDAVSNLRRLFTFDFSNNTVPQQMVESIVSMCNRFQMLEILCLDHCEMTDQICNQLFPAISNTKIEFLNISWNHLSGDCLNSIVNLLIQNQGLKKLALQHNRFGTGDVTSFAKAIRAHQSLEYLDVSKNFIGNHEFKKIFLAVTHENSHIKTFCCRKNKIGGKRIDNVLTSTSRFLSIIDLQQNNLTEQNAIMLYEQASDNIVLSNIKLQKNILVNAQLMNDIDQQCRQNNLIRSKIMRYQTKIQINSDRTDGLQRGSTNVYTDYNNSQLILKDTRLDYMDFIRKFFIHNNQECRHLVLQNLDVSRCQGQMALIFSKTQNFLRNIQILHIEGIKMENKPTHNLCKQIHKMQLLESLSLVNIESLENEKIMDTLARSIQHHKYLKFVDLRQMSIRTRKVDSLVTLLSKNKVIEKLDISNAIVSKQGMMHLWLALHKNISVCDLICSRINFFALQEMTCIDMELNLNNIIRNQIAPVIRQNQQEPGHLSLNGLHVDEQTNPAIIKYIKLQKNLTSLDLSNTKLTSQDIKQFVLELLKREIKLTSLNLSNCSSVDDDVVSDLCCLFSQNSTIKELRLDRTEISEAGLKKIFETIKQSLKVHTLSVEGCRLSLKGKRGVHISNLLKENISLTHFNYKRNKYDSDFFDSISKELDLNKQIEVNIIPQLVSQEKEAREKTQITHRNKRRKAKIFSARDKRQSVRHQRQSMLSNELDIQRIRKFQKQDTVEEAINLDNNMGRSFDSHYSNQLAVEETVSQFKKGSPARMRAQRMSRTSNEDPQLLSQSRNVTPDPVRKTPDLFVKDTDSMIEEKKISIQESSESSSDYQDSQNEEKLDSSGSSYRSDSNYGGSEKSDDESDADQEQIDRNKGFNLCMKNMQLDSGIEFLTKFTRVFKMINTIDFGNKELKESDLASFSEELKLNQYIQDVVIKKKGVSKEMSKELEKQIKLNKQIAEQQINHGKKIDLDTKNLQLHKLQDVSFLPKMIADFSSLEKLDLSDSDLRSSESVLSLCQMIDDNDSINSLVLRKCMLNARALNTLSDSLRKSKNQNLRYLDITLNPIQDEQYKVLFGLLQSNQGLLEIDYTLYDEANIDALAKFKDSKIEDDPSKSMVQVKEQFDHDLHDQHSHHHELPLWQKIVFPIWLWKSMIHDKHEAFRFKYDTVAIGRIEEHLMPGIKRQLYYWSILYYFLTFAAPYIFIEHECEKTYDITLFYLYGAYLVLSGIWEIYKVMEIQRLLANKTLLQFNKWHVVELFMGSIARTDTFLDICFIHIILNCWEDFIHWVIPTSIFACINLIFPFFMLLRLLKNDFGNSQLQPYLESACFVSFIRENMLLATVLDSFCINNSFYFMGKPLVFGKLMGVISFFTQDAPQLTIHVLFKLFIFSEAQYKLKTQTLLLIGMVVSSFAVLISLFNMIMCAQNEFDPIVLEQELMLRRMKNKIHQEREQKTKAAQNKKTQMQHMGLLKDKIAGGIRATPNKKNRLSNASGDSSLNLSPNKNQSASPSSQTNKAPKINSITSRFKKQYNQQDIKGGKVKNELNAFMNYASTGIGIGRNNGRPELITEEIVEEEADSQRQLIQSQNPSEKQLDMIDTKGSEKHATNVRMNSGRTSSSPQSNFHKRDGPGQASNGSTPQQSRPVESRSSGNKSPSKSGGLIKRHKTELKKEQNDSARLGQVIPMSSEQFTRQEELRGPNREETNRGADQTQQMIVMQEFNEGHNSQTFMGQPSSHQQDDDKSNQSLNYDNSRMELFKMQSDEILPILQEHQNVNEPIPIMQSFQSAPPQLDGNIRLNRPPQQINFAAQDYNNQQFKNDVISVSDEDSEDADDAARTLE